MKRILYLAYYLKEQNWKQFNKFFSFHKKKYNLSTVLMWSNIIFNSVKYNISPQEYFQFAFFELKGMEKRKWAGTGTMYEYQLKMNPKSERDILDDKRKFFKSYSKFVLHKTASLEDLKNIEQLSIDFINISSNKIVLKVSDGKCATQVEVKSTKEFGTPKDLILFMENNNYDLVEEFIVQHPELSKLSPSAVNTVRIITQLNSKNEVDILGCRQRISVNSSVDNLAAGNIAACIDIKTGVINSPAIYSDICKDEVTVHPLTKVPIVGFTIPFWKEAMDMVKNAALLHPQNRSIGWDVVITENGPGLIEGNHDWCKLLWQLPVKKGLKPVLDNYLATLNHV